MKKKNAIEYFIAEKALEEVSGDQGFVEECDGQVFVGLIDGLGHGPEANEIALISQAFLKKNMANGGLDTVMKGLHEHIQGSRGCVAVICSIDIQSLLMRYSGIGNVVLRTFGTFPKRATLRDGVIGYNMRTPKEEVMQLSNSDVLILTSDGIKSSFNIHDYPEILEDNPETIATNVLEKFGKWTDDQICIALRCE